MQIINKVPIHQQCSLNILIISYWDFQDEGMQVTRLTPLYFARQGHHVTFMVHSETTAGRSRQAVHHPNLEVCRFNLPLKWMNRIHILGRLRQLILFALYCLWNVARIYHQGRKPDIIYAAECDAILIGLLMRRLFKVPLVSRYYGVSTMLLAHPFKHLFYHLSLKCPTDMAIVTDDGTDGERVIRSLNSRIGVLHFWRNGIDQPYIDREKLSFFRKRYGFRPHDLVLIMASRLYSWKRVDRAIKAVQPLIQAKKMKLRLLIVGDGPEKPNLEKLAERLGIKDIVNLAGPIAHKDIYNHYALADVFLSCYDMSNVGNPLWEALNIGKCIVVLNTGKTGDVIKDGVNGLLVEPTLEEENTVQGISQAISRIYNDVKLRKRLALGAKTYGERMLWTWEERLERELASLKKLARKAS